MPDASQGMMLQWRIDADHFLCKLRCDLHTSPLCILASTYMGKRLKVQRDELSWAPSDRKCIQGCGLVRNVRKRVVHRIGEEDGRGNTPLRQVSFSDNPADLGGLYEPCGVFRERTRALLVPRAEALFDVEDSDDFRRSLSSLRGAPPCAHVHPCTSPML